MQIKNKKIVVTGGAGFLGKYVVRQLETEGVNKKNILVPRSNKYDLRIKKYCDTIVKNADIVIHLAGNVGGIGKNQLLPATLFYDNIMMGVQLIHAASESKVKKMVILGTICAYPKYTSVPFKETDLWNGYPEETNAPYGLAKKMLLVQSHAYRKQYGFHSIYLLPVNLYGPGDNFEDNSSHVIPAIIKKIADAIIKKKKYIEVWGDGSPTREFLYVEDAARAIVLATKLYDKPDPINLGSSNEISIKTLVETITKLMNYKGNVRWLKNKPNGQPRRKLDIKKAKKEFGFVSQTRFVDGLKKTIDWYLYEYDKKK